MLPANAKLILTACPDEKTAKHIAKTLVQQKLAAAVNILPSMHSVYAWEGEICEAQEYQILIISMQTAFMAIKSVITALHPYKVPEIIQIPIEQSTQIFLQWIQNYVEV